VDDVMSSHNGQSQAATRIRRMMKVLSNAAGST